MSSCAHGNAPFDSLDKSRRDKVAREAISLIRKYAELGIVTYLDEQEFKQKVPRQNEIGGPYEFCVWNSFMGVRAWLDRTKYPGKVSYFFEAGDKSQRKANALLSRIFQHPELKDAYRLSNFGFVDKKQASACQAADLLAWQWNKEYENRIADKDSRKDFEALVNGKDYFLRKVDVDRHAEVTRQILDEASS
jgi:hypothetical protein